MQPPSRNQLVRLQDPAAALQLLATALLSLAMRYQQLHYILELPQQQLAVLLQGSAQLQGLARAAGVRLTLLCSYTAANTQVSALGLALIVDICLNWWLLAGCSGLRGMLCVGMTC
jgi:hypothetical protein